VETDRMGVAHHTSYLVWFEEGRTDLMREAGHPYWELEAKGVLLPVVAFQCRIVGSADYGDPVTVETWVERIGSRIVIFAYRALAGGRLLAEGTTTHLPVDRDNRPCRLPDSLRRALAAYRKDPSAVVGEPDQ
jgi:acyl-CoA thioester hydrolase